MVGATCAQTIRKPRDWLNEQPQERQRSAARNRRIDARLWRRHVGETSPVAIDFPVAESLP
jgi:hypothetical protein